MTTSQYPRRPAADKPTAQRIASNIEAIRLARGWTLVGLSRAMGEAGQPIPVLGLRRIRVGRWRVDYDELMAFARIFDVTTDLLIGAGLCSTCKGVPPSGFQCQTCGAAA